LVILLIGYHHMCLAHMKKLATDSSEKTHVYFRFFNEVPVIFMIAIVILVIVKPF
jgi:putative membrane protein